MESKFKVGDLVHCTYNMRPDQVLIVKVTGLGKKLFSGILIEKKNYDSGILQKEYTHLDYEYYEPYQERDLFDILLKALDKLENERDI